ncbi:PREDICTED: uncharacterized protein LOC109462669 [Branchiostoma belcheri]|uniref:Uncharacterized protein LOC109462669 n=1 Tax=Branchiostoma belcheri TaxID=7741 RepID=A0A6P4XRS0_BRABE|nr:PREDICTED: uncharacterized protein LOC109462669 [Branchiostoma belcheri]
MQNRVVKSERVSGWGSVAGPCPGCLAVNLGSLVVPNTPVPPHLHVPGCPSQNPTLHNDDDDVIFVETPTTGPPQLIQAGNAQVRTMSSDEDDLQVTYVSLPETAHYPHARGDCKIHTFKEVDLTTIGPVENNATFCEKCYCFMCDVPASQCQQWTDPTGAHCNAYKCPAWMAQQTSKPSPLLSRLTVELITQEVRDAVRRTDELVKGIQEEYVTFRKGKACLCTCHQLVPGSYSCDVCNPHHIVEQYDYSVVKQKLLVAVQEARGQSQAGRGDAGMVILDSLIHVLVLEKSPPNTRPNRNVGYKVWETKFYQSRNEIMKEIDELLMDIFVLVKTTPALRKAVIDNLTEMLNREGVRHPWALSIRQWEDRLLSLVLTGSNLTGRKGTDVLLEPCMVIRRRVERLKHDGNYRQAVRYLKCVNIPLHNSAGGTSVTQERADFLQLQHQVPLLYVRCGSFNEAFMTLTSGPVDAKHLRDSIIAKMDGGAFLELMKSLSTDLCGVKGLPTHKILWACLIALTMNVGVQLNLEFLVWFVQWAASKTIGDHSPSYDETACNRARSLIQASQSGVLTVSALKETIIHSRLAVTASEAVLYPLFAHRHDAHLDSVASAFGTKLWAFECSLNSCTLSSVFASTHLCQWLQKKYLPQYGASRIKDTVWSNVLISVPQPMSASLIEDMLNTSPAAYATIFSCLGYFTTQLVAVPTAKVDKRLLGVLSTQIFPMAKAADHTALLSNIVKLSFFNDPNEATVLVLRELYVKEWPKVLDSMIRVLPPEKMEVALVSCFSTCVKKGEVDIVVRMLHANRAGHASAKTAFDYVPTVSVLVEKLAGQLPELDKDVALQLCDGIKDWLRDESYCPLLCQNCNYDISLISLNNVWKSVGSICPDRLEHILAHAMKRLGKAVSSFHMVKQAQRSSMVSWLKRVATVMKQMGKKVEYQVHLSFLVSAISTKRGLVKEIQSCPELAADIIPGWMLQEWEGKYVRSMSEWSVKSSGPTKLTFRKTISPGPVSPVYNKGSSPEVQQTGNQLSHGPAAVLQTGVGDVTSVHASLKESNNNVRAPGSGNKDLKNMSLEDILQYNFPAQANSMVNGEAVHPVLSRGGSPQVAIQPADARYARQGTPDSLMAANGMAQPRHYNPAVSNSASQALHMVASRRQMANNASSQNLPLENQQMASTSAMPPSATGSSTIVSGAGSNQAVMTPPPPLISDAANRPQTDQVPPLPTLSRAPPPQYEAYMRSWQNSEAASQPLPPQSSASQNVAKTGRPLDRMANFVNSLVPSSSQAQTMTPYQMIQPRRYPIEVQQLSNGQALGGMPQHPMQPAATSSPVASTAVSQAVQPGVQIAPQQCSTTAVLDAGPTVPQLQNVQSQMDAATTRTLTPELQTQLQPAGSTAAGMTTHSFQNAAFGVSMPVSSAQQLPTRFPTSSEPVHVFIPNVHQNLVNGTAAPMSVVHHFPSPQPFAMSSQHLQGMHPASVSSSVHTIAGQAAQGLPVSTLGPVGQQTGSPVDTVLQTAACAVPQPVKVSVADTVYVVPQEETQAPVSSAQDAGPVPVHVTFIPPPGRQEEEEVESEDDFTFDTTMPSPPRNLEIDEIVLISDSEEETLSSGSKPDDVDDDSPNKEDQGEDELPEGDSNLNPEQSLDTEDDLPENDSSLIPEQSLATETDLETDSQPKDSQQSSEEEPLLHMSCESIDSDIDEARTVPQPGKGDARENVVKISSTVQENTLLSERAHQNSANVNKGQEENSVEVIIQEKTSLSERAQQASANFSANLEENGVEEIIQEKTSLSEMAYQDSANVSKGQEKNVVEPIVQENPSFPESMLQASTTSNNPVESDVELIVQEGTTRHYRTLQDSANVRKGQEENVEEPIVQEDTPSSERTLEDIANVSKGQEKNVEPIVQEDTPSSEGTLQASTNLSESSKSHDQNKTEQTQIEEEVIVQENNASTEADLTNADLLESNETHEENGLEHMQGEKETIVLEHSSTTEAGQSEMESAEGSSMVANSDISVVLDDVADDTDDRSLKDEKETVVLEHGATTEAGQSEMESDEGSSMVANSDISVVVDDVANGTYGRSDVIVFEQTKGNDSQNSDIAVVVNDDANDTDDRMDANSFEQTSGDKENESQMEEDNSTVQDQCTIQDDNLTSKVCLDTPADIPNGNDDVKEAENVTSAACLETNTDIPSGNHDVKQVANVSESSGTEKPYAASDNSQLKEKTVVVKTNIAEKKQSKETDVQISSAVAGVVARLVMEVVKKAEKGSRGTQMTTNKKTGVQLSKTTNRDKSQTSPTKDTDDKSHTRRSTEMTAHKDTRTGKKRKAEAHANDVVKKTKKIPSESDAKEATGNSTKRTSGNAKEDRKVALEKGSNSKPVRSNNLNAVEHRSKLNRAHSKQGNIKDKTTDSKNGRMPNGAGKTVDLTKLRSGKVEGGHPRSGRKDRESVRKDGLVSLEIMTVDASAEAKASVTVQELRTVRRNVSFEERKPNKTTKESPSCRSLRAPGTRLRSSSCDDDTATERNTLRRWLGRPTKGRTSGPLKTALFGSAWRLGDPTGSGTSVAMWVRRSRKNVVGAVLFLSVPMAYLALYGAGKLFQLQREWTGHAPPKIRQIAEHHNRTTSKTREHTPLRNRTHQHSTAKPLWAFNDDRIAKVRRDIEAVCHLQRNIAMTKWNTWVGMAFPYDQEPRKILRLTRTLFNLFPEKPPFEGKLFNTCSVVGNGGILLNSGCGSEIDSSDFVFRCNLPPIRGFEKDVGRKVNLTTMNPSILRIYYGRLATERDRDDFAQKMVELRYSYLLIPIFVTIRGAKDVQILSEFLMSREDLSVKPLFPSKIWAKTVNFYWKLKSGRKLVESRLTTGLQLLTTALSMCKHVNMYGYYPSEISPWGTPIPYHYYEPNSTYNYTFGMGGIHNMTKEYEVVFQDLDVKRIARLRHRCSAP